MSTPRTEISLRPANERDAEALAALCGQLGYPSTPAEIAARLAWIRKFEDQEVLVAECAGRVSAWMTLSVIRPLESPAWAEIDGLIVDETHRGLGIGAMLVDRAKAWAREQGVRKLRVRANEKRTRSHRFYERCRFVLTKSQRVYDLEPE